jgi:7-keto-8-aminopelargonate synthetase-like enzyme/predicted N-acyltransferase
MAKTRHHNIYDTVDELFTDAKKRQIMHLTTEDSEIQGRLLTLNGRSLVNFGTLGYLGLEQHEKLKNAAIDAIKKFGTQFSASRAYVSLALNEELEELLGKVFDKPVLTSSSTSLGHIGVLPSIIHDEDAIILDHQVHASIQNAAELVRRRGIPIEIIRHNNLEMLEEMIKRLGQKYKRIWFMIDGVFSMYGDFPPLKDIVKLLDIHEQLHLYVDDAHGMSWAGKHGRGYVLSQIDYHPKMVVASTLGKGFGVGGGIFTFPDYELWRRVKTFGGALSFSVPSAPAVLAAAVASAKIHLTDEIYLLQKELQERITYCNSLIRNTNLPLIADNCGPVFFIATGTPSVGYNIVKRIMNEGFFVNLAIFPAVPVKNTGIRFSISRHVRLEDIKGLIEAMNHHLPLALDEENYSFNEIRKAFKMPLVENIKESEVNKRSINTDDLIIQYENTIDKINKEEWNILIGENGSFDYEGLKFLEDSFKDNNKPEDNWKFHYLIVKDKLNKVILGTFYTTALWKEDMLAPASVSMQIEEKRKNNPYYLTSVSVSLGSFATEGNHLFLDRNHPAWQKAFAVLVNRISKEQELSNASTIILRDFEQSDVGLRDYMIEQGFIKIDMPESCVIENLNWNNTEEFLNTLSPNSKKHIKKQVLKYEDNFEVEIKNSLSQDELKLCYELYMNVKRKNYDLNTFDYPEKLFHNINNHSNWEFIFLKLKAEFDNRPDNPPVAIILSYKTLSKVYCPMIIGMDYNFPEHNVYRQALFRLINRAKELNFERVNLGLTANLEKKKFGARIISKVAYVQARDNFNMELIGLMPVKGN